MPRDIVGLAKDILNGECSRPFSYEAETLQFRIGQSVVPLTGLEIFNFYPEDDTTNFTALVSEAAIVLSPGGYLTQMPRMTNWLKQLSDAERKWIFPAASAAMQGAADHLNGNSRPDMFLAYLADDPPKLQTVVVYGGSELGVSLRQHFLTLKLFGR